MHEAGPSKLLWGFREKIKNADAQLFVAQLERKKEANPAFFMISLWMRMES
jgi:hypothetical protein